MNVTNDCSQILWSQQGLWIVNLVDFFTAETCEFALKNFQNMSGANFARKTK